MTRLMILPAIFAASTCALWLMIRSAPAWTTTTPITTIEEIPTSIIAVGGGDPSAPPRPPPNGSDGGGGDVDGEKEEELISTDAVPIAGPKHRRRRPVASDPSPRRPPLDHSIDDHKDGQESPPQVNPPLRAATINSSPDEEKRGASAEGNSATPLFSRLPTQFNNFTAVVEQFRAYKQEHYVYITTLFVSLYLYKQTFAIPGSFFLNIIAGTLFGMWTGFALVCCLTTVGSTLCYLFSELFSREYVLHYFGERLTYLQQKVDDNSHRLLPFLLFARMFPISPSWLLNIVAPFLNIPLPIFALSALIGLAPYNFICVQAGYILAELRSWDDVFSTSTMLKLCSFALLPLAYALFLRRGRVGGGAAGGGSCDGAGGKNHELAGGSTTGTGGGGGRGGWLRLRCIRRCLRCSCMRTTRGRTGVMSSGGRSSIASNRRTPPTDKQAILFDGDNDYNDDDDLSSERGGRLACRGEDNDGHVLCYHNEIDVCDGEDEEEEKPGQRGLPSNNHMLALTYGALGNAMSGDVGPSSHSVASIGVPGEGEPEPIVRIV